MAKRKRHHRPHKGLGRKVNTREKRTMFLIVCEGKTEEYYFDDIRVRGRISGKVKGIGEDPVRVIEYAIKLMKENDYEQVWCVFDKDNVPVENFNKALRLAIKHNIERAYSNKAFELWYVLHFNYHDTGTDGRQYKKMLKKLLNIPYKENLPDMYERLETRQEAAIQNAEKLLSIYDHPNPARNNPSTTVHLLVNELNRFAV